MDLVKNIGRIDHHHIFSGALGSTGRCVCPFHKSKSMAGWIADTAARTASDRSGLFFVISVWSKRPAGIFLEKVFHYKIVFSWQATVLAAVVISFPLMYRSARGAIEQVDANLIYAGRTLGMSERTIFWKIVLPQARPGILSGGVLAFTRGLGEFGATAMIAGNIAGKTRTLPLAIYSEVAAGDMDTAGKYVLIIVAFSLLIVAGMNLRGEKKDEFTGGDRKKTK